MKSLGPKKEMSSVAYFRDLLQKGRKYQVLSTCGICCRELRGEGGLKEDRALRS